MGFQPSGNSDLRMRNCTLLFRELSLLAAETSLGHVTLFKIKKWSAGDKITDSAVVVYSVLLVSIAFLLACGNQGSISNKTIKM